MISILIILVIISIVVLLNLKELIKSDSKVKIMLIFFFITGIVLALAILIKLDRQPPNPFIALMDILKAMGLESQQ